MSKETLFWTILVITLGGWLYRYSEKKILSVVEQANATNTENKKLTPKLAAHGFGVALSVFIALSVMFYFHDLNSNYETSSSAAKANISKSVEVKDFSDKDKNSGNDNSSSDVPKQATDLSYMNIYSPADIKTTFEDVAGLESVKDEVQDILHYLRAPENFSRLGAKPPKGMIIEGQPGTGKTLLARALAGEAGVTFISTSGSSFEDTYIGVGASRVRELFRRARYYAPCIIFIDEIDSIAKSRDSLFMSNLTQTQTINQLLAEMDGLDPESNKGVFVIAATNRVSDLDSAILRPGRLDRKIHIDLPTLSEREEVLQLYLDKIKADSSVDKKVLAKMTTGFSSADLAELVNEAAIHATKKGLDSVGMSSFEIAKEKIILGLENKSMVISPSELKMTAYHEAGHTIVGSILMPEDESIYKVTIAPRGPSLGATHFYPETTKHSYSKKYLESKIAMLLGGRAAEELIYGKDDVSTGASNDFKVATEIAYNMVTKWGLSDEVGNVFYVPNSNVISEEQIQKEVQVILDKGYASAKSILMKNKSSLNRLAKELVEHETLDGNAVKKLLKVG